jgi:formyltetrahydrofolate deformylase
LDKHILLLNCPDAIGLVHKITGVLYRHGYNIVTNNEFVGRDAEHFFMRTEFSGQRAPEIVLGELREVLPPAARVRLAHRARRRIVVLATREHHCLGGLRIRHTYGDLNKQARISCGSRSM